MNFIRRLHDAWKLVVTGLIKCQCKAWSESPCDETAFLILSTACVPALCSLLHATIIHTVYDGVTVKLLLCTIYNAMFPIHWFFLWWPITISILPSTYWFLFLLYYLKTGKSHVNVQLCAAHGSAQPLPCLLLLFSQPLTITSTDPCMCIWSHRTIYLCYTSTNAVLITQDACQ